MLSSILPPELFQIIEGLSPIENIYEIRIRFNSPIVINICGEFQVLRNNLNNNKVVYADNRLIDYIICKATDSSLYSFNNQIKQGFVTVSGGIRIGITGEVVVSDDEKIKTIKNFSSLCIRIPHEIINCASTAMSFILGKTIKNTLLISPPGAGKTTFLRDIARSLSNSNKLINTLVIDERFEIGASIDGLATMDIGSYTDILSGSSKAYGFKEGIRTMRPDVIICDELATKEDIEAVKIAINSGVKVIASAHSNSHIELRKKSEFETLFNDKVFERYIVLSTKNGMGTYEGIFDENCIPLYFS
jgi:stage III sporulation protein AA